MLYISLRQYEYVCAIGRHGSLSAAAHALNVSQPALSTALTRVESLLGYPLFMRRRGAAMTTTPQGRLFIEQAEKLLHSAAQIENPTDAPHGSSHLRLGCFIDLAPFHLASALRSLQTALPDVTITYHVDSFEGLLDGLINGQTDIAITYDLGMDAGYTRQELFDSVPHALVPPDHPLATAHNVTLADLELEPLILSKEGLSAQHVLNLFRRKGLNPTVAHRAATLEIQRSLAAYGEGIAISYASPNNSMSYDNRMLTRLPILDKGAAEPVVLARHGTGPVETTLASAERVLFDALSETRPEVSCEDG
jgi:DNA-binding transcriptional LysR family regulator